MASTQSGESGQPKKSGGLGTNIAATVIGGLLLIVVVFIVNETRQRTSATWIPNSKIISAKASSVSDPDTGPSCDTPITSNCEYSERQMLDGLPNTVWFANEAGTIPYTVTFRFDRTYRVDTIEIAGGWQVSDRPCLFTRNERPHRIDLLNERGETKTFDLDDGQVVQALSVGLLAEQLTLKIVSVYSGVECYSDSGGGAAHHSPGISDIRFKARKA